MLGSKCRCTKEPTLLQIPSSNHGFIQLESQFFPLKNIIHIMLDALYW
jgi:hypothetical protein